VRPERKYDSLPGEPYPLAYDFRNDPILGRAYEYWQSKCGERAMPSRRDIDPSEITRLLPHLQIHEFVDGGARIRYRLVGTAVAATYGVDHTGKYFDEIFAGERLRYFEDNYRLMCRERRPILMFTRYVSRKDIELICHRVVMPLSENDAAVNQALVATSFQFPAESIREPGQWQNEEIDPAHASCEIIR
jgi:hypothetical protein